MAPSAKPNLKNQISKTKIRIPHAACLLPFAFWLLAFLSCASRVPRSFGPLREVTVITDHWQQVGRTVEAILARPIPTPQPEPEFLLRVGTSEKFPAYSKLRLLFLIGTAQESLFQQILKGKLDSLPEGGFELFSLPNAWVDNQWVLIFIAKDTSYLIPGLQRYQQRLYQTITEKVLDQLTRATYQRGIDTKLTAHLQERFGWRIDVPLKWLGQDKDSSSRFVYIFSHFPDRSVFVHWADTIEQLTLEHILRRRDKLTTRFYEGDSVDRQAVLAETTRFLGVPALRVRGVWQNRQKVIGGPFVLYAFNYQERFFILDGVVFNPGEKKLSNLFQMEAILRTFIPAISHSAFRGMLAFRVAFQVIWKGAEG